MELIKLISENLNVPSDMLADALKNSRRLVKHLKIPKRDGTLRTVYQPSKKLKIIQYWLIENVFKHFEIHHAATAFQKDKSIKINAFIHKKGKYFLKLDFKNFFPSIIFDDFKLFIHQLIKKTNLNVEEDELSDLIRNSCFYRRDRLPIGYPTSPIISNIVMYDFDTRIVSAISDKDMYGVSNYTRYADDLTFSTDLKGACDNIKKLVEDILNDIKSPDLTLNTVKTKFVSSSGGSAIVTGLRICHDGHITIHRKYKDKIRLMLSLYSKGKLSEDEIPSLKGHLGYIRHVDGSFYTKLQNKHFMSVGKLLST